MAPDAAGSNSESWDEAQYEAALAQLEALSDRVTALRTAIPSLVAPLTRPATTKSAAFAGLKKAAVGAVTDVADLRREWESEGTQNLLKKTKESFERDGDLSRADEVPNWGWVKEQDKAEKTDVKFKSEG